MTKPGHTPPSQGRPRTVARRVLSVFVTLLAILYFLIDLLALLVLHPLAGWVARWRVFGWLARWIRTLGPYPTLALFLIPYAVLEPAKPVGAWLVATGHAVSGIAAIIIAELLKIVLVERLFHMSRDKLMTIPAFAWCFVRAVRLLDRLKALPPWQAVLRATRRVKEMTRRLAAAVREWG